MAAAISCGAISSSGARNDPVIDPEKFLNERLPCASPGSDREYSLRVEGEAETLLQSRFKGNQSTDSFYETGSESCSTFEHFKSRLGFKILKKDIDSHRVITLLRPLLTPERVGKANLIQLQRSKYHTIIQEYIMLTSTDNSSLLGECIRIFIQCTCEIKSRDPESVLSNVRQFISGCKNYIVRSGEGEIQQLVELQRSRLRPTEYLNLDNILEDTLHALILKPLRQQLRDLLTAKYTNKGYFVAVREKLSHVKNSKLQENKLCQNLQGIEPALVEILENLQLHYSALEKLNCLYGFVNLVLCQDNVLSLSDLVTGLVFLVSRLNWFHLRIELDYIRCILEPRVLFGDASYYISIWESVLHSILQFNQEKQNINCLSLQISIPTVEHITSTTRSNELCTRSIPVFPTITLKLLQASTAHAFNIPSGHQYILYHRHNGKETKLTESSQLQEILCHDEKEKRNCCIIFRPEDSNIILPL